MRPPRLALVLAVLGAGFACEQERPPPLLDPEPTDAGSDQLVLEDGSDECPEAGVVDQTGSCGNVVMELERQAINLYFVVDRSGSMSDPLAGGSGSKYDHAREAIAGVLERIGGMVSYGAAVFPGLNFEDGCAPGGEVFRTRPGDSPVCTPAGERGPVLSRLLATLSGTGVGGGTPTAATLVRVGPILKNLLGATSVVLITDGGPNCNGEVTCGAETCTLSLDQAVLSDGTTCSATYNCCDPALLSDGSFSCLDDVATEAAVASLASSGIRTYVIGMPGSGAYAAHLDRLAEIGLTARAGDPQYYPVANTTELSDALWQIGTSAALSCDVQLTAAPEDPALVNVYLDRVAVPFDAIEGWSWTDDTHTVVRINGSRCDTLAAGGVYYLQVQWGCPTYVE